MLNHNDGHLLLLLAIAAVAAREKETRKTNQAATHRFLHHIEQQNTNAFIHPSRPAVLLP